MAASEAVAFNPNVDHSATFVFPTPAAEADSDGFIDVPKKVRKPAATPASVIWDWDNGKLPKGYNIEDLKEKIEQGLKKYDKSLFIKNFFGSGEFYSLAFNESATERGRIANARLQAILAFDCDSDYEKVAARERICAGCQTKVSGLVAMRRHQQDEKCDTYQDDYSRVTDVGDAILARVIKFLHYRNNDSPGVLLLISEDKDFGTSLKFLVDHGWIVLIAEPNTGSVLRAYSRAVWFWDDLYDGKEPCLTHHLGPIPDSPFDV